jgi:hypothetical protein
MEEQTDEEDILFLGTITVKNDPATFSLLRLVSRYSDVRPVWRDLPGTEQLTFERFGLSLLDTWIHVKLPWLPCKQNRDRVVCKIKDVPKRSHENGIQLLFT